MIEREVFLAAAKALRRQGFDAIDDDNRINVIVDGTHRSVDTAEFSIWLVAEHDEKEASRTRKVSPAPAPRVVRELRQEYVDAINRLEKQAATREEALRAEVAALRRADAEDGEALAKRIDATPSSFTSAARSLSSTEAAMTSRDMSLHGGERIPYQEPWTMPERPWLVHVVKRRHRWAVWCPCCRQWSACESFADSLEVVRDILPTGWEIRRLSEGGALVKR